MSSNKRSKGKALLERLLGYVRVMKPVWQPRLTAYAPLAAAALTLLLGLLPLARVPDMGSYDVSVNAYQFPAAQLIQFLIFPLAVVAVWAMARWVKGFAAMEDWLLLGAAALQVVSLFLLSTRAGETLREILADELQVTDPAALPQRLALGFWLLLATTVLYLVLAGLRLAKGIHFTLPRLRFRLRRRKASVAQSR